MLKKLLKVLLGLVVLGLVVGGIVLYATQGVVKAADSFLEAARGADINRMKPLLSKAFSESASDAELIAYLKQQRLDDVRSTSWSSRSVENNAHGKVAGKATLGDGSEVTLSMEFVKEDGAWKVLNIKPQ